MRQCLQVEPCKQQGPRRQNGTRRAHERPTPGGGGPVYRKEMRPSGPRGIKVNRCLRARGRQILQARFDRMWRNLTADPREQDGAERAGGERRARSLLGSRLDLSWCDDSDQRGGTVDPARESKVPATSSAGEGRGGGVSPTFHHRVKLHTCSTGASKQ